MTKKSAKYKDFKKRLLEDAEVRREYDALEPQFNLIRQLLILRKEQNISQDKLASLIGTQQSAISRLERGDVNATFETWQRVAAALNANLQVSLISKERIKV